MPRPPSTAVDDGGEVVVREDHVAGFLRHLGSRDPHRNADVGAFERRCVIHAVARHRNDVALALQRVDEAHLVLGRDARDDPDAVDLLRELCVVQRRELCAGNRTSLDSEVVADRRGRRRVVAGDHADTDPGLLAAGDRVLRLLARRIHDPDQCKQRQALDLLEELRLRVERRHFDVARRDREYAKPLAGDPVVLGSTRSRPSAARGSTSRRRRGSPSSAPGRTSGAPLTKQRTPSGRSPPCRGTSP